MHLFLIIDYNTTTDDAHCFRVFAFHFVSLITSGCVLCFRAVHYVMLSLLFTRANTKGVCFCVCLCPVPLSAKHTVRACCCCVCSECQTLLDLFHLFIFVLLCCSSLVAHSSVLWSMFCCVGADQCVATRCNTLWLWLVLLTLTVDSIAVRAVCNEK